MKSVFSYAMCATQSLNTALIFCILHNCSDFVFAKRRFLQWFFSYM